MSVVRRRSRRRKRSYRKEDTGVGVEARLEDLSPRAQRLVESGVIDLSIIVGSGEGGRITSGDILHAARVIEMEQSVARIETVGQVAAATSLAPNVASSGPTSGSRDREPADPDVDKAAPAEPDSSPVEPAGAPSSVLPADSGATMSSAADMGGQPIEVPANPWDAYNGSSDGLSESALPGAEQSWGEAEDNIAAIVEEAAARLYGRPVSPPEESAVVVEDEAVESSDPTSESETLADDVLGEPAGEPAMSADEDAVEYESNGLLTPPAFWQPTAEPAPVAPPPETQARVDEPSPESVSSIEQPEERAASAAEPVVSTVESAGEAVPAEPPAEPVLEVMPPAEEPAGEPAVESAREIDQQEIVTDFGTLELVDPASVWEEGADYFAPWFLAHSKQLGDVLGLQAGLSDARQYTTKSASGVLGRDDNGEDVIVVSSEHAVAGDPDLGRALGMAASSGAATVALVSARFDDELLQALSWLNSQTQSGVKWFGIEMKVVRIADSPPAMLFELVASPLRGED